MNVAADLKRLLLSLTVDQINTASIIGLNDAIERRILLWIRVRIVDDNANPWVDGGRRFVRAIGAA